jgi:hypothetical protein
MIYGSKIRFTKHALEKFKLLKYYGFEVSKREVSECVSNPARLDQKADQHFALKPLNSKYALRAVYEERKGYLVVITFYPVRRERYGI